MRTKTIRVTEECIRRGETQSTTMCPVAIALKIAGLTQVSVYRGLMKFQDPDGKTCLDYAIPNPPEVSAFIFQYDDRIFGNNLFVKPFEFELRY